MANAAGRQAVVPCQYDEFRTFLRLHRKLFVDHQILFVSDRFRGTGSRAAWDAELQKHMTPPANACILCGTPGEVVVLGDQVFWLCDDHPRTAENEARVLRALGECVTAEA